MKSKRIWRTVFIFCVVVLISAWVAPAQGGQESQKLKDFRKHVDKHYGMEKVPADTYCAIYGFVFRLQWDMVMAMPEGDEKARQRQHLDQLWWDLRDFAFREGEKWKNAGKWPSGGEGMVNEFKGGFELLGKTGELSQEDLKQFGGIILMSHLANIPSLFDDTGGGGGDTYDDVTVQALKGTWTLKGTYVSTGRSYGQVGVILYDTPQGRTNYYFLQLLARGGGVWDQMDSWLLTDDGIIELIDFSGDKPKIQFFRERKDFWSGITYEYNYRTRTNVEIRLILYRNQ